MIKTKSSWTSIEGPAVRTKSFNMSEILSSVADQMFGDLCIFLPRHPIISITKVFFRVQGSMETRASRGILVCIDL